MKDEEWGRRVKFEGMQNWNVRRKELREKQRWRKKEKATLFCRQIIPIHSPSKFSNEEREFISLVISLLQFLAILSLYSIIFSVGHSFSLLGWPLQSGEWSSSSLSSVFFFLSSFHEWKLKRGLKVGEGREKVLFQPSPHLSIAHFTSEKILLEPFTSQKLHFTKRMKEPEEGIQ